MLERAVLYDKYSIDNVGRLMNFYYNNTQNYAGVIELGEFFLTTNDIDRILAVRQFGSALVSDQVKSVLLMLLTSYNLIGDRAGTDCTAALLRKHFARDSLVNEFLNDYAR